MGKSFSKSADMPCESCEQVRPAVFSKPWRTIKWGDNEADLKYVKNYEMQFKGRELRILLLGHESAGKSSFINSVQTVLTGRIYALASADCSSDKMFTKEYKTYKVRNEYSSFYPFVFCDIMGLGDGGGVLEEDVKMVLRGHVKEGYKFDPAAPLDEDNEFYKRNPNPSDKVHVVVYVFAADKLNISEEVVQKIRSIRMDASSLNIAQIAVLTKIDQLCPEMKEDLRNVYVLQQLKEKMEKFSAAVGIPMNCIFPVKNYHEEIDMKKDMNTLIFSALRHIIHCGDDCNTLRHSHNETL
ncbi:interferon-induced protein 44 [Fundulus heteroclitus]|uniref:interferon-induced protein 44 n=1 Tax=Fundulus heteroclitus TaxID=8078 RepID=UPI00165C5397|nr:interferon-induced protein 44 [Fundulus heteroclitus]